MPQIPNDHPDDTAQSARQKVSDGPPGRGEPSYRARARAGARRYGCVCAGAGTSGQAIEVVPEPAAPDAPVAGGETTVTPPVDTDDELPVEPELPPPLTGGTGGSGEGAGSGTGAGVGNGVGTGTVPMTPPLLSSSRSVASTW